VAIFAYPFDGVTVTESQYSKLFRELQDSGVADAFGGAGFKVTGTGSSMVLTVAAGVAVLRGHAIQMTADQTVTIAAASPSTRIDRVVLRMDPSTNSIAPLVLTGTPGSGAPALTQTDTGLYELPLATVTVAPSAVAISNALIADYRPFVGSRVGIWSNDTKPTAPRRSQLGYNTSSSGWEWFDGSSWVSLGGSAAWAAITDKPSTFTPSTHGHDWNAITGKPSSFTPSSHVHDWVSITGKPSSFPPDAHTHSYAATSHTHALPAHVHTGANVTRGVDKANGSDRPHSYTPAGSSWYAVWVDGNHDFCRNTSSIRYKQNVRPYSVDPDKVLALEPRVYDRKGDDTPNDEYGLIAEEVNELVPEIVIRHEGEIDSIRYDLLSVALLDVVKRQQADIEHLTGLVDDMSTRVSLIEGELGV
jgi:hypothetical protein